MAITELALLRLKNHKELTPEIRSKLKKGAAAQAEFSSHPVHLFVQEEDPSYIYLLGGWASISQHMTEWIPSPTNQELMSSLMAEIDVVWMFHIDIEPRSEESALVTNPLNAPVIAIARYYIPFDTRGEFDSTFTHVENLLQNFTAPRLLRAGYRLDYPDDKKEPSAEFVMFSGWESAQEHWAFTQSEAFETYARTREYMLGAEIRHARLLQLV